MTTWYDVEVTALQDLSLGSRSARAFLTRSHHYVPGSVIRGALAAAWITRHGTPQLGGGFATVFDGGVRFGPCLPEGAQLGRQSVERCKYHEAGDSHPVFVDRAWAAAPKWCDGGQVKLRGGVESPVQPKLRTSTALQQGSIVAATSQLFAFETLPKGTVFKGQIVAPDGVSIEPFTDVKTIFLGARTHSLGRCTLAIRKAAAPTVDKSAVLVTQSPTLLVDAAGRPTLDLRSALEDAGLTVEEIWADRVEPDGVGGWHVASGLPKPNDLALAPGATAKVTGTASTILKVLERGLGVRRAEGFGWVALAGAAYEPLQRSASTAVADATVDLLARFDALGLDNTQKKWFANTLRRPDSELETALTEPAAKWLSDDTRDAVIDLLHDVDPRSRQALAAHAVRTES